MNTEIGPLLSDKIFFGELLNCSLPGLEGIPSAAASEMLCISFVT